MMSSSRDGTPPSIGVVGRTSSKESTMCRALFDEVGMSDLVRLVPIRLGMLPLID